METLTTAALQQPRKRTTQSRHMRWMLDLHETVRFSLAPRAQLADRDRILDFLDDCTGGEMLFRLIVLDRSAEGVHWLSDREGFEEILSIPFHHRNSAFADLLAEGSPAVVRHHTGEAFFYFPVAVARSPLGLIQISRRDLDNARIVGDTFRHLCDSIDQVHAPLVALYQGLRHTISRRAESKAAAAE